MMSVKLWSTFLLSFWAGVLSAADPDSSYHIVDLADIDENVASYGRNQLESCCVAYFGDDIDSSNTRARIKLVMQQASGDCCWKKASDCHCCDFQRLQARADPPQHAMQDGIEISKRDYIEAKGFGFSASCDEACFGSTPHMACTLPFNKYNKYFFIKGKFAPFVEEGAIGLCMRGLATGAAYTVKLVGGAAGKLCGSVRFCSCQDERVAECFHQGSQCGEVLGYVPAVATGLVVGLGRLGAKFISHTFVRGLGMACGCILANNCPNKC